MTLENCQKIHIACFEVRKKPVILYILVFLAKLSVLHCSEQVRAELPCGLNCNALGIFIFLEYSINEDGLMKTSVVCGDDRKLSLDEFLNSEIDDSLHEIIRTNVLTATRNFHNRLVICPSEIDGRNVEKTAAPSDLFKNNSSKVLTQM